MDSTLTIDCGEQVFTLLGVRSDGVATVVDLLPASNLPLVRDRAQALLREHASCQLVEVWRDGALVETFARS